MAPVALAANSLSPSQLFKRYNHALKNSPIGTKSLTCMAAYGTGDVLAQVAFSKQKSPLRKLAGIDGSRAARMALYGLMWCGPAGHGFYSVLDKVFEKHVRGAALSIAGKVGIDQLLYAPFSTAIFFAWANIAAGTAGNISNDLSSKLVPSVKAAWALWVPAMLVNMALIPPDMRILWISATAIVWTIVLSGMASEPEVVAPLVTDVYDVASLSSLAALLAQDAPAKRGSGSVRRTSRDVARTASGGRIPSLLQLLRLKLIAAADDSDGAMPMTPALSTRSELPGEDELLASDAGPFDELELSNISIVNAGQTPDELCLA